MRRREEGRVAKVSEWKETHPGSAGFRRGKLAGGEPRRSLWDATCPPSLSVKLQEVQMGCGK